MGDEHDEQGTQDADTADWDEIEPGVPSTAAAIPGASTDDPSRTDPTRVVSDDEGGSPNPRV
jgi:hypothetical protein